MRHPAHIEPHLSVEKMFNWLQRAPNEAAHKRRMAIWLTYTARLHANRVARSLGVSVQAVWLWIRQYNQKGPAGLYRPGRGGRRWAFLSMNQEAEILKPFIRRVRKGDVAKASEIKPAVEAKLGKKVSMPYIYKLLARHRWYDIIAQSHSVDRPTQPDNFSKIARPWERDV